MGRSPLRSDCPALLGALLVGGLRTLNANPGQTPHGVFTHRPETLSNDVFVNLLDTRTAWQR